jgi:ABC-type bacteriocin/lantibiotic exporter with double-glycine peptidase domain
MSRTVREGMALTVSLLIFLSACTSMDIMTIKESIAADPEGGAYIEGVPFFPQEEYYCGPASLASVMGFYGLTIEQQDIADEVYLPGLKGTLPIDVLLYAKGKGFNASYYGGSMDNLKRQISMDRPVILFLNLGYDIYPKGHYIVAVGYNDGMSVFIAHSGREKERLFSYEELEGLWRKTGFATILIGPKDDGED